MTGTLNKVMLIGHTGDDVKMHYFEGGGAIGRFPLATNEVYTNKSTGQRVENTEWHNIVVRNKAAEICEKYLKKGDKVYVEGRLKSRKWTDDKGIERYSVEIQCTDFTFLTPKNETAANPAQNSASAKPDSNTKNDTFANQTKGNEEEDDLPF
ncbi:single-strand binding protein [Gillisia mitskevichiae]|uniref:Single-stranded DNA-binding protein n=1 Tax=Gillisia mitskevichiae TaxID=270921 RepID=A0A495PX41_9FLAO|nr:single-stranded DNA-binding protein [Gillisia mitskevichiae]RKS55197.1 single-strand binding protein [Gillisia mitskevichiae]